MKQTSIIILTILCLYGIYLHNNRTVTVSLKETPIFKLDDYNVFYLDLEDEDINTLNLNKYITHDMEIISIIPYVNPIYKDKIGNLKYNFSTVSYQNNINNFTKYYKDTINNSGYLDNLSEVDVNGIKINEIEVYTKGSNIVDLIYQKPKIKYKNFLSDNYKYLEF